MKGHTSNQLHIKTLTTMCKSVQIIASNHKNVHKITRNSNGMDTKCKGIDSKSMDIFCVFHVNDTLISSVTVLSI